MEIMRIVLRRISTGLYYLADGSWAPNSREALEFGSPAEAHQFAKENGLLDIEVVKRLTYFQDLAQRVRVYFAHYG
jgi:hypothetical protein